ncbi:OPSP protein, partial [Amia calva]|nr:OPSP protein [Amia calva]
MDPANTQVNSSLLGVADVEEVLMPRIGYTMLAFIMAVFSTAAIILNSTVILVTIRYRQLRHPINYSLVNLAVADLGVSLSGGLMTVVTNAMGYFSLGRTGCVIEGFAVAFFVIFNPRLHINPIVATVPMYMTKTSTVYNPLIYIFMNRQVSSFSEPVCSKHESLFVLHISSDVKGYRTH